MTAEKELTDWRDARDTFVAALVSIGAVLLAYWFLLLRPEVADLNYRQIDGIIQFSGSNERIGTLLDGVPIRDARLAVINSLLFALVWGGFGFGLLRNWWQKAWKTGIGKRTSGLALGAALAGGGAIAAVLEKLLTLASITADGDAVAFVDSPWSVLPKAIVTLAWVKWLLAGLLICAVVAMAVSATTAFIRFPLPARDEDLLKNQPPHPDDDAPPAPPAGVGISCSGGGIRAAGFTLGCLSRLESQPGPDGKPDGLGILGRADYLASVSGGGYAAVAWRIAAGTDGLPREPIIGNPLDTERQNEVAKHREAKTGGAYDLLQHIRDRRHYLANGAGGLWRSALRAIGSTAFHFLLVLLAVVLLAWPIGRIMVTRAITGIDRSPLAVEQGLADYSVQVHQWLPPLALAVLSVVAIISRLGAVAGTRQKVIDLTIKASAGMAIALFVILIGLPWAVDQFIGYLPDRGGEQFALAGMYGVALTAAWQYAKSRLQSMAKYLGGVLLAVGLVVFSLYVMASAADTDEPLSSAWVWGLTVAFLILAFVVFNPDRWSLHSIYRDGLAGTFATERTTGGVVPLPFKRQPSLAAYREARGPKPVVCCAAARDDNRETGIKVLSMTLDPDWVTVHGWKGRGIEAKPKPRRLNHAEYKRRLPRSMFGISLHTLIGAAAVSGAAVAPSLGRMDMRSTNALLAAFNARLGVWVPNPTADFTRSTTPRLVNMFKEIGQIYGETDPNVYATDGGHWENLGMVELIRRRCATIVVIDASGDPRGSYQTFKDAIELARLECDAKVTVPPETWENLAVTDDARAPINWGTATVEYSDTKKADLLYIKAAVSKASPIHIQRYASSDRKFPDYSTGDQLLDDDEFHYLTQLGYQSTDAALTANPTLLANMMAKPAPV